MIILVDSREQKPLFEIGKGKDAIQVMGLSVGDYSCLEYEDSISIERKSVPDAVSSVLRDRKRFQREMERAETLEFFGIVIEGTIDDLRKEVKKRWSIMNKTKGSRAKNCGRLAGMLKTVPNTYLHWEVEYGCPVMFCKNRAEAKYVVKEWLKAFIKKKEREKLPKSI